MIRLDNRQPNEIKAVIEWSQEDDFWQDNILSTTKLRKHFDQLSMKMGKNKYGKKEDKVPAIRDVDDVLREKGML